MLSGPQIIRAIALLAAAIVTQRVAANFHTVTIGRAKEFEEYLRGDKKEPAAGEGSGPSS